MLGPAPPLNDAMFQAMISDEQISDLLHHGRDGYGMPAFSKQAGGELTDAQIQAIIDGIRQRWMKPLPEDAPELPAYQVSREDPAGLKNADRGSGRETVHASRFKMVGE